MINSLRVVRILFAACLVLSVATAAEAIKGPCGGNGKSTLYEVATGHSPRMAADPEGNLHVVFQGDERNDVADIFHTQSNDNGVTWSAPEDVSRGADLATHPDIAIEPSGAIDCVWSVKTSRSAFSEVYFSRSSDGGKNWTNPVDVSNSVAISVEPALAVGKGNSVYVVWSSSSNVDSAPDVYCAISSDFGKTWTKPEDISATPGASTEPTIAVGADGTVHVAWLDATSGGNRPDIYYVKRSSARWSAPKNVSDSPRVSGHPALACGTKGKTYLVWSDNSKRERAADIWCARMGSAGKDGKVLNISNTPGVSSECSIVAGPKGEVGVVWSDTSSGKSTPDIYTRVSCENLDDVSFAIDLSKSTGVSLHPHLSIVGKKMFVVWEELDGQKSRIKATSMNLRNVATGPSFDIERRTIYGHVVEF